ncbi:MAG: hypothetical protein IT249_01250 [Chitinophagaceae bacterium]|nr:hypothetical protein [Chitinophagaceae bacterium]
MKNILFFTISFCLLLLSSCQKEIVENIKTEEFVSKDFHEFYIPIEEAISKRSSTSKVECTDWYSVTYSNGQMISEKYLYTTCNQIDNSGGGDSESAKNTIVETNSPCPQSFQFGQIVKADSDGGGWQQAGLIGLHFNVVSTTKDVRSREVLLPTIYFGMPITRANGDFYSSSTAASNTARAVKKAEVEAYYYGRANPSVSDRQVATYWLQRIDYWMKYLYQGSATKQPATGTLPTQVPTHVVEGC